MIFDAVIKDFTIIMKNQKIEFYYKTQQGHKIEQRWFSLKVLLGFN
jgi:hypothetical protein